MNDGTHRDLGGTVPFLLPFETYGDDLLLAWDYAHEYTNPVTPEGWPEASTGPRISPSEHFTFCMSLAEMRDRSVPSSRFMAGFSRLGQWWPWMRMGGHELAESGVVFGRMFSHKGLKGPGDIPPKVLAYIEKHAPEYLTVPDSLAQREPPRHLGSLCQRGAPGGVGAASGATGPLGERSPRLFSPRGSRSRLKPLLLL